VKPGRRGFLKMLGLAPAAPMALAMAPKIAEAATKAAVGEPAAIEVFEDYGDYSIVTMVSAAGVVSIADWK